MSTQLTCSFFSLWLTFLLRALQPAVHSWRARPNSKSCCRQVFHLFLQNYTEKQQQKFYVPKLRSPQWVSWASATWFVGAGPSVVCRLLKSRLSLMSLMRVRVWSEVCKGECIVICQRNARQRVGRQSVARLHNNRGISVNILTAMNTGNNRKTAVCMRRPVNNPRLRTWQQYSGKYFLCGPRQANARNNRTSIARERSCKHAIFTKEDGVFRRVRAEEFSWRQSALRVSQLPVGHSHWKFAVKKN
jgi:hypothetical protein